MGDIGKVSGGGMSGRGQENIAGFVPARLLSKQSVKTYFSDFAVINDRPLVLKEF